MTLLEVVMATSFLTIGVVTFAQALLMAVRAQSMNRERAIATQAARQLVERMRSETFSNVFRRYNTTGADDPGGPGTAPGASCAVTGLRPRDGDADGLAGEILFPVAAGAPGVLRENVADLALGTPRDLDGDLAVDGADHTNNYRMLPVVVRVRWRSPAGNAVVDLRTMLGDIP
jgi:type II secretory pathway pseudopilin PulG